MSKFFIFWLRVSFGAWMAASSGDDPFAPFTICLIRFQSVAVPLCSSAVAAYPPDSRMAYDPGLASRVADGLESIGERGIRQKNVFGGRGFLVGKSTFVIVTESGLIVKSTPSEYPEFKKEPGVEPFAPGGERPMTTWLAVDAEVVADDPELTEWIRRGLRALR